VVNILFRSDEVELVADADHAAIQSCVGARVKARFDRLAE
jgi:hypothetical protein